MFTGFGEHKTQYRRPYRQVDIGGDDMVGDAEEVKFIN